MNLSARKLGGWQRLWVVATTLWGLLVVAVAVDDQPTRSDVDRSAADQALEALSKHISGNVSAYDLRDRHFREVPDSQIVIALRQGDVRIQDEYILRESLPATEVALRSAFQLASLERRASQKTFMREVFEYYAGFLLIGWAIPMIALYMLGRSAGWVYEGFRNKQ